MSNIFLDKSKSDFFNNNSKTLDDLNHIRKMRFTKYNPYRPKKSNSLNRNSFFSLMNVIKNGDSYYKKIDNRRGLNYIDLSLSRRNKEKNNSIISNSYTNIMKRNYSINFTKDKWYTKTNKDEKNKVINLLNEKKIKERENFYFKRNKRNRELNKHYFNSDFNQEEKNSGIILYKQPKLTQRLNYFIDEHLNNTFNFIPGKKELYFNHDKKLNIFPLIQKKQIINNNYINQNKNNDYNNISEKQIYSKEIKSDITLNEYYYENCDLLKNYAYKENSNKPYRPYMEDKSRCIINLNNDISNSLFCLFDGHGGEGVSLYLQNNFHIFMKEHFPFDSINPELFFNKLFNNIDVKLQNLNYYSVGSTASIIYIKQIKSKKYIYSVNIGDSRILLIKTKEYKRISYDDRASDINEFNRITKIGGLIFDDRVYGQLMLSRSFGDWELKKYGVISKPHLNVIEIGKDDLFIVIASDGIWDVLDDIEIYDISSKINNSKEFCDIIVNTAIDKGSTDNISCFVLKLN